MSLEKLKNRSEAIRLRQDLQGLGKKVGFTSGVFDLLHPGHVDYLERARGQCDFLMVALNSDASVKSYKAPERPICEESDRARVLAGLQCVDCVFIFGETNNNKNVELLKPDFYFKAGDYDKSELSSAPLVEQYGGKVVIIPALKNYSSSSIIARVADAYALKTLAWRDIEKPLEKRPAAFLDRDGTLIEHVEYLHEEAKLRVFPGVLEAMKRLKDAGFYLVVITNQPGIGLGYFSKEDFFRLNRAFLHATSKQGATIDKIYFCPHSLSAKCDCRKPASAMIDRAVQELNIDLSRSVMVGDMSSDIALAKKVGCHSVLVETGQAGKDGLHDLTPDFRARDMQAAAEWIVMTLAAAA